MKYTLPLTSIFQKTTSTYLFAGVTTAILLTGCGGSGGSDDDAAIGINPPTNTQQITVGVIDGFGSVIVNGIHFETNGTEFEINDDNGSQDDLRVGQVITIVGRHDDNNGTATRITYDANIEGPVTAVNVKAQTIEVLGQVIILDNMTTFERTSLETLAVGDSIEASGFYNADNNLVASFIELNVTPSALQEVHGIVSNHDSANSLFTINNLSVDYSAASIIEVSGGSIANDMRVEVKGTLNGDVLMATKVEEENRTFSQEGNAKVRGLIQSVDLNNNRFTLNGITVQFGQQTQFKNGSSNDLAINKEMEVEGRIDADGVLQATEVEFEIHNAIEIESFIEAVDVANSTVTVMGKTMIVDVNTRVRDKRDDAFNFNIEDLSIGDWVEVRAVEDNQNQLHATRLEREESDDDEILKAPVESASNSTLVLLGITVDISSTQQFQNELEQLISREDFLAAAVNGQVVKAKGAFNGSTFIAEEVELEVE